MHLGVKMGQSFYKRLDTGHTGEEDSKATYVVKTERV